MMPRLRRSRLSFDPSLVCDAATITYQTNMGSTFAGSSGLRVSVSTSRTLLLESARQTACAQPALTSDLGYQPTQVTISTIGGMSTAQGS